MSTDSASPETQPSRRRRSQIITALFLAAVIALIFLLATSVSSLRLLDGQPFSLPVMARPMMGSGSMPGGDILLIIFRILLALSLIALPFYIILSILTKEGRQRLLQNIVIIAVLVGIVLALRNLTGGDDPLLESNKANSNPAPAGAAAEARPLPDFTANPSDATVLAATLAISLLLVGIVAAMIWVILSRRQPRTPSAMQSLADEAQSAINAIQAGGPLEETIARCYRDMCNVLQQERGIARGIAMTPSEFEQVLQDKGMPAQAVHQLTHLFEQIRYGSQPAGPREEQLAIESLTAIVAACGQPQQARA
jgi:hypothetical protein